MVLFQFCGGPCEHCLQGREDHAGGEHCLFQPTKYRCVWNMPYSQLWQEVEARCRRSMVIEESCVVKLSFRPNDCIYDEDGHPVIPSDDPDDWLVVARVIAPEPRYADDRGVAQLHMPQVFFEQAQEQLGRYGPRR